MPATISLTESGTLAALRAFLLSFLPAGVECVRGQNNRVAEPSALDYIVMTPILRTRLATNVTIYLDTAPLNTLGASGGFVISTGTGQPIAVTPQPPGWRAVVQATQLTVQLDVHGPNSADNSQIITTLFRDTAGCDAFTASGFDVQPLYCGDARQIPFINGEAQYEDRWVIDAALQMNPLVTVPQEFTNTLIAGLVDVDAVYPPT